MDTKMKKRVVNWIVGYHRLHEGDYEGSEKEALVEVVNAAYDILFDLNHGVDIHLAGMKALHKADAVLNENQQLELDEMKEGEGDDA